MVHGGVHRQVPRRQSFSTFRCRSVCPRRAVCNRDWPVRLPFADSGISEGNELGGAKKGANGDSSRATSSHAQPRSMQLNSHIERLQATARYSREVPSKQRVASSNPAGRANSKTCSGAGPETRATNLREEAPAPIGRTRQSHRTVAAVRWLHAPPFRGSGTG
jgi:hypothetical protein